jgi:hypothetical protein
MKAKILIIALWVFALLFGYYKTKAQDPRHKSDTVLLADETYLTYKGGEAKITSYNEKAINELFKSHSALFRTFRCTWKHNRSQPYKLYEATLFKEDAELIIKWSKINL